MKILIAAAAILSGAILAAPIAGVQSVLAANQTMGEPQVAQEEQWDAQESWNTGKVLVYTLKPDGTFASSDWDNGRGQGVWARDGASFVMIWPGYSAFYVGSLKNAEVRGTAYTNARVMLGTFVLHRRK